MEGKLRPSGWVGVAWWVVNLGFLVAAYRLYLQICFHSSSRALAWPACHSGGPRRPGPERIPSLCCIVRSASLLLTA
eukprot:544858-Pyramimonas_sp.AAC.1